MDIEHILNKLLTEDGRRRAIWILLNSGMLTNSDVKPKEPVIEDNDLSEMELNIFDTIESLLFMDEYDQAYTLAVKAIRDLMQVGKFKSALYVCQMIGDEILRREILSKGLKYYESRGDFKKAMDFAMALGDIERHKIYKYLYELYCRIIK